MNTDGKPALLRCSRLIRNNGQQGDTTVDTIVLETSSYLPLLWRTPYSQSVVEIMGRHRSNTRFVLQRDCIREAAAYFSFREDWRYHPAIRFRRLAERLTDAQMKHLRFPSTAMQLLLGGNVWPQAQYLNFVRHMAFFCIDLLDGVSFEDPRAGLLECAKRIEQRVGHFRALLSMHERSSQIHVPQEDILSYWGTWYLLPVPPPFVVEVVDDPVPFDKTGNRARDLYHYDCALRLQPRASFVLVANTGFERNIRSSYRSMPVPVVCARASSATIFA